MKLSRLIILNLIFTTLLFQSCNDGMFEKVTCRDFTINGENYWFPVNKGDTVTFVNASMIQKKFVVTMKYIKHRTEYTSDTGCGCLDESAMQLISGTADSIWFYNDLRYVYDQTGNYYEEISMRINTKFTGFYETNKTKLSTYTVGASTFNDVERFDFSSTDALKIKTLYRARNIGIIQFELVNGEVWTKADLTTFGTLTKESFDYTENTCE